MTKTSTYSIKRFGTVVATTNSPKQWFETAGLAYTTATMAAHGYTMHTIKN